MDLIFTQTDGLINLSSLPRDKIKDYSIAKGETFLEAGVGTRVGLLAGVVLGIAAIVTGTILLIKKYEKWETLKTRCFGTRLSRLYLECTSTCASRLSRQLRRLTHLMK